MELENLWAQQQPLDENLAVLKRDFSEGRVPELPYYVVGQKVAKEKISSVLNEIDGMRMQTLILRADYGCGKTNMLKYLDLFFRQHILYGIKVLYQNTNVEQRDLFMVLLRLLQHNYLEEILLSIKNLRHNTEVIKAFADNFNGEFVCIQEYVEKLFAVDNDDDRIRELLLIGTGQLYSIRVQRKIGLDQPLSNFERRCVLALFLNILAYEHKYVLFALDEVENMYNVSKKRMALFLTTYRDLVDKFSFIKGHLFIFSITRSIDLSVVNPPLYDRIHNNIIDMEPITDRDDVMDLLEFLQHEIIETNKSKSELRKIAKRVSDSMKMSPIPTRELVRKLVSELKNENSFVGLESYLESHAEMKELYEESRRFLTLDGVMADVYNSFFDPLSYYMEALGFDVKKNLKRRDYNAYIDENNKIAIVFTFNNSEKIVDKLSSMLDAYSVEKISLFVSPMNDEVTYASLSKIPVSVEFVEYNAADLLILFDMFKNHIEKQDEIAELIHLYTHDTL